MQDKPRQSVAAILIMKPISDFEQSSRSDWIVGLLSDRKCAASGRQQASLSGHLGDRPTGGSVCNRTLLAPNRIKKEKAEATTIKFVQIVFSTLTVLAVTCRHLPLTIICTQCVWCSLDGLSAYSAPEVLFTSSFYTQTKTSNYSATTSRLSSA
jgi:hypothetical protein